jgi:hypothetical protein
MIEPNDNAMPSTKRSRVGPLANHIDGFAVLLGTDGYAPNTAHDKCEFVADLSRWLDRRGFPLNTLDERCLSQFHAARRHRNHVRGGEEATGQQLLRYLRDLDCIPALPPGTDQTALGDLILSMVPGIRINPAAGTDPG